MANMPAGQPSPVVENLHAPEVFADLCVGAFLQNGALHITFASMRMDHGIEPNVSRPVVIARLVMPFGAADNMQRFLAGVIDQLKAQAASQGGRTLN
jgi:hypothetical protein